MNYQPKQPQNGEKHILQVTTEKQLTQAEALQSKLYNKYHSVKVETIEPGAKIRTEDNSTIIMARIRPGDYIMITATN